MKKVLLGIAYWLLQCTWGILETIIGLFIALFMVAMRVKPKRVGYTWYFETSKFGNIGGFSMGTTIVIGQGQPNSVLAHEYGHTIQNCIFGPFKLFICSVFSVLRYWLREHYVRGNKDLIMFVQAIVAAVATVLLFTSMTLAINGVLGFWFISLLTVSIYLLVVDIYTLWEEHKYNKNGLTAYDSAWFEGTATKLGKWALQDNQYLS